MKIENFLKYFELQIRVFQEVFNLYLNLYDEILKIAEGVINKKKVTKATGKVGYDYENQVNTVVGRSRTTTPGYVRNRRINSNTGNSPPGANCNCFCCKTDEHPGGWRKCPQLGKLYPDWKLGDRPPLGDPKF